MSISNQKVALVRVKVIDPSEYDNYGYNQPGKEWELVEMHDFRFWVLSKHIKNLEDIDD